jgi:nucleoside-diphosphate-sugar epimerase
MSSKTAVVGSTGFVGSNLMRQVEVDDGYNSKNVEEIAGKSYDLVFCAGARAEMWKINADPETDRANNLRLMSNLAKAKIKTLVLISTVGVFPSPIIDVNEDSPIDTSKLPPYGLHHLEIEQFCSKHFDTTIVRLPGLFGRGLKKNIIYDLLHGNNVDQIHADSVYQFYYLEHLWVDVQKVLAAKLKLAHFAPAPTSVQEVAKHAFGINFTNRPVGKTPAHFDFRSKHADVFGGHDGYMTSKQAVLDQIRGFVETEQAAA